MRIVNMLNLASVQHTELLLVQLRCVRLHSGWAGHLFE